MRREELYLGDILEAADHVAQFIAGFTPSSFRDSEVVRSAVMQKLSVIGEAAARVSQELKARHPEVPWARMVAFRNILVHAYFGVDWNVVWLAASKQCPHLRGQVAAILASEF
jgi:uncharacterized protein with HEPN domain